MLGEETGGESRGEGMWHVQDICGFWLAGPSNALESIWGNGRGRQCPFLLIRTIMESRSGGETLVWGGQFFGQI